MKRVSDDCIAAFRKEMEGRQYGMEELFDALYWFMAGWDSREEHAIAVTREAIINEPERFAPDKVTHVAGISSPRNGWSEERKKKHAATMRRIHAAKKARASKARQKAKGK